jgi:AcrR family transcriptional regulator
MGIYIHTMPLVASQALDHEYYHKWMVNTAKSQNRATSGKRPRLSQAEAEVRMKNATAQLLLAHPPADVTVHMISAKAGVHHDYVARYFGSREELMIQTIEAAVLGTILASNDNGKLDPVSALDANDNIMAMVNARLRTMSYLLACGVSPERFIDNQKIVHSYGLAQFTNPHLTDRTKMNFTLMAVILVQGMAILGEVNDMTEEQKADIRAFITHFSHITEQIQTELKWDKPVPKKRK